MSIFKDEESPLVVLDTCVLYPLLLRDALLRLAERGLYEVRWSEATLVELDRNLARKSGMSRRSVDYLLGQILGTFRIATVKDYGHRIPEMTCHPKDRHVLAAAAVSGASAIVTFNTRDFPTESTEPHSVSVVHPDEFLLGLLKQDPADVIDELERQAAAYQRDPKTLPRLLEALAGQVPRFVEEVRRRRREATRTIQYRTSEPKIEVRVGDAA